MNSEFIYNIIIEFLKRAFKSEIEFNCYIDYTKDHLPEKKFGIILHFANRKAFIEIKNSDKISIDKDFNIFKTFISVHLIDIHLERINELKVFHIIKSSDEFEIKSISDIHQIIKEAEKLLIEDFKTSFIEEDSRDKTIADWLSVFAV